MAQEFNNSVFGISFQDENLTVIENEFEIQREMDDYDDTTFYLSKRVYQHDLDPDFKFEYQYGVEAYRYEDENDNTIHTFYTLYLIPTFKSLCDTKQKDVQKDVLFFTGNEENPNTMDVFDYGMNVILCMENTDGEYDKSVMDKIASVINMIDGLRGFYLDKIQNRIGTTGWMLLDDFINDKDSIKATLEKYSE